LKPTSKRIFKAKIITKQSTLIIYNVYAPCEFSVSKSFFLDLRLMIAGDFNTTIDQDGINIIPKPPIIILCHPQETLQT